MGVHKCVCIQRGNFPSENLYAMLKVSVKCTYMRDVGYLNLGASKDSRLFARPLTKIISLRDRS